jgi:hypothetical protein
MVFVVGTSSPAFIEFLRYLGATKFHFGLLSGLPMIMLAFQFIGALICQVLPRRKKFFMIVTIAGRLLFVPVSLLPVLFPEWGSRFHVNCIVVLVALSSLLANSAGPIFFSWMADMIPHSILNRYWGIRQRALHFTWTASYLLSALFLFQVDLPINIKYPIMAVLGVICGVVDIVLFTWIKEPVRAPQPPCSFKDMFLSPVMCPTFGRFLSFVCLWSASVWFIAGFMAVYLLERLNLGDWRVTLIFCSGIAVALAAPMWGRMADKHGNKPVMAVCVAFKPILPLVFCFVSAKNAFLILPWAFLFDSFWESGMMVATNGYMLKVSPSQKRPMFVASLTALSGIAGGGAAIAGGIFLDVFENVVVTWRGLHADNFFFLFIAGFFMRCAVALLVTRIREPESSSSSEVMNELKGAWPTRLLMIPMDMYRRIVRP